MQIHKIDNTKMEILINSTDLEKNSLSFEDIVSSSAIRYGFLHRILKHISLNCDFNFKREKIIIDFFSVPSINSFILNISYIPFRVSKSKYIRLKSYTYFLAKFSSFESLCAFCNALDYNISSTLFYYNDFFYLSFMPKNLKDIKRANLFLKEFVIDYKINYFVNENANLIVKNNAIEFCKKFV